jgi:excisionase family DNA binding protein
VAENTDKKSPPLMMTPKEAADELRISRSALFGLLKSGAIRSALIGPQIRRIARADLVEYVEAKLAEPYDAAS